MSRCRTLICLLAFVLITLPAAAQPYETNATLAPGISVHEIRYKGQPIHYAKAGDESKPGVLFVHGTPGSWQAYAGYLADPVLQNEFLMVAIDRPGWGGSKGDLPPANVKQFDYQARAMLRVLEAFPNNQWLVVGHSLGASMAPKLALLDPDRVRGLLLLAGSLDPSLGRARWYNIAASLLVIRWLLPASLKYSNDEIMVLHEELRLLQDEIEAAMPDTQVVVMQGMKDKLVSPKNIDYVADHWSGYIANLDTIKLPTAGHFLPWENADRVRDAIRSFEF